MTYVDQLYKLDIMKDIEGFDEFTSTLDRRAQILVRNDARFLAELVEFRKNIGLTQAEVAARMNVTQPAVAVFERVENDPKLSTIRRYAMAVGLLVDHLVERDEGDSFFVNITQDDETSEDDQDFVNTSYALELSYA